MHTSIGELDGNGWQDYCNRLLALKYNDYQSVPDRFGGDLGIEGFTHSGIAVQCYCPDGSPSSAELYAKQRDKITKNIGDLIKNEGELSKILGATKIREWYFLTPKFENKELLKHCEEKRRELLARACSHIDPSFRILIKNDEMFAAERQKLMGISAKISPETEQVTDAQVTDWISKNDRAYRRIDDKLTKVTAQTSRRALLVKKNLQHYLIGSSMLDKVRSGWKETYESIMKIKQAEEARISECSLIGTNNNGQYLRETMDRYEKILNEQFGQTIDRAVLQWLTREAISDWLLRCPLDFPEQEGANG